MTGQTPLFSGKKALLFWILPVIGLTLVDQLTKYLAVVFLKNTSGKVLIPGVLELSYLENRGMAFGMLQGKIPFLLIMCFFFLILALYIYIRMPKTAYYIPLMVLDMVVFAGALGNFVDRFFREYVVDFIYFSLIDFPTFNVADIYVVCGGILTVLFVLFKYKDDRDFDFLKFNSKR
nr:signal peptidase II [uncultured Blautia sp.]